VTSEFDARSFDRPRERAAPSALNGHWCSGGAEETVNLTELTLVVAIKSHCDGCQEFINADLGDLGVPVLVISADDGISSEWHETRQPVFVSPEAFRLLDVRWPPFYVLIDPVARRVVSEGVVLAVPQVAAEIGPLLDV
jgi:hypothetical protein